MVSSYFHPVPTIAQPCWEQDMQPTGPALWNTDKSRGTWRKEETGSEGKRPRRTPMERHHFNEGLERCLVVQVWMSSSEGEAGKRQGISSTDTKCSRTAPKQRQILLPNTDAGLANPDAHRTLLPGGGHWRLLDCTWSNSGYFHTAEFQVCYDAKL